MFALVDCNNFYCSCERLFQPGLNKRPVVVLSNNDGCVISRSDEAKAAGIVMGAPAYLNEDLFKQHNVKVFSSNYTLYGDLSDRVMKILTSFVPKIELYSIDEAFLDMSELGYTDLKKLGLKIRETILQDIGIPVCVGIAPTKTLAKVANRYAKKKFKDVGVFYAANQQLIDDMLGFTEVNDIWGVGHQYATLLRRNGMYTAKDIITTPEDWFRVNMTVVGQRLYNELKGIPTIKWEYTLPPKKNICTSRSFGKLTGDISVIKEALSNYAAKCAMKLRKQHSVCKEINVFMNTNPHKPDHKQYYPSITIQCETATNSSSEIIRYALKALDIIFKDGYLFMKCGVIVNDLSAEDILQQNMFDLKDRKKENTAMVTMDKINRSIGKDVVKMAVQRFDNRYKLRTNHLSPKYTTRIDEILKVKI